MAKGKRTVYMEITRDKYELPVRVCDTATEMANELGLDPSAIYSAISHAKAKGLRCRYVKVEIDDD